MLKKIVSKILSNTNITQNYLLAWDTGITLIWKTTITINLMMNVGSILNVLTLVIVLVLNLVVTTMIQKVTMLYGVKMTVSIIVTKSVTNVFTKMEVNGMEEIAIQMMLVGLIAPHHVLMNVVKSQIMKKDKDVLWIVKVIVQINVFIVKMLGQIMIMKMTGTVKLNVMQTKIVNANVMETIVNLNALCNVKFARKFVMTVVTSRKPKMNK